MKKILSLLSLLILLLLLGSCGDKNLDGSSDDTEQQVDDDSGATITSSDFSIDETDFADTSNFIKVPGKSNASSVELRNKPDGLVISATDITTNGQIDFSSEYRYETFLSQSLIEANLEHPLYIDGVFSGIIEKYEQGAIVVKNAVNISDAYEYFDISASNDEIVESITRSIKKTMGAYDHMNVQPLKISFIQKDIFSKQRTLKSEPVVVIEFPKGYKIPLKPLSTTRALDVNVDCELSEAMCDAEFNYGNSYEQDLETTNQFGSAVFTTVGSKIEIGLGAFIRAKYDYNTAASNEYRFEFKPTAYYLVNIEAAITGGAVIAHEYTFDIVQNGLDIPIPLPQGVKLNINIKPELVIGMEEALNVEKTNFKASLKSTRTGYVHLVYSSDADDGAPKVGIKEEADPLVKAGISVDIDTKTDEVIGYLFPQIAVRPQLGFLKVDKKINIAYVRNGARVDTKLRGLIKDDWVVENTEISGSSEEDVYLKTELYGLIDFKWDIKVGDTDLYSSDKWKELYKSEKPLILLEWYSQLLHSPKMNLVASSETRIIDFDIQSSLKQHIRYYYTTDGTDIDKKIINDNRDSTPYLIWRDEDAPLTFSEDTPIKVRAVVFTDEITAKDDTLWRWGMSISKQVNAAAIYLPQPTIDPVAKEFKDPFAVNVTDLEGNMIEYDQYGTGVYTECGVFTCAISVSKTANITFRTVKEVNGNRYTSNEIIGHYRQCADHEGMEFGSCINQCPFLWDITYQQTDTKLGFAEDGKIDFERAPIVAGSGQVLDVLIFPRCDFSLGSDDSELYKKCAPYLNAYNDPALASGNYKRVDWNSRFEGEDATEVWFQTTETGKSPLEFNYAAAKVNGAGALCNRDPYPNMPLAWLPAAYKEHSVDINSYPEAEGDVYVVQGADNAFNVIPHFDGEYVNLHALTQPLSLPFEEDIFAEIIERKSFSYTSGTAKYTFVPRVSKEHVFTDSFCLSNPGYCVDKGLSANAFCTHYPDYCALHNITYTRIDLAGGDTSGGDEEDDGNSSVDDDDNGGNIDGSYDDWESGLWRFNVSFTNDLGSGSMTVNKFPIDLSSERTEGDYIFVGNDYGNYPEGTTVIFSGALQYDDGLSPLTMTDAMFIAPLDKTLIFNAILSYQGMDFQIGSSEMAGGPSGNSCDGHLPSGSTEKIVAKETVIWTWSLASTSCTFTLQPVQAP
ncbi:hypothetical protein [Psychromonas antarctica]|uniref:hypothetical protein n=1 Tax=Psychromonas antarctica TaxID=67573 RepID=UPI001EE8B5BD|nr:hypothetical protein [Psychromonas antarctica]MCG6201992.1 hypothetical protein [Psychromonas antarctica]